MNIEDLMETIKFKAQDLNKEYAEETNDILGRLSDGIRPTGLQLQAYNEMSGKLQAYQEIISLVSDAILLETVNEKGGIS